MTVLFDGEIFADYHQFYLADARDWSIPDDWVDDAMASRIHCSAELLMVTTARDMNVPVRVELHDREPQIAMETVDHVVLGSVGSGGGVDCRRLHRACRHGGAHRGPARQSPSHGGLQWP